MYWPLLEMDARGVAPFTGAVIGTAAIEIVLRLTPNVKVAVSVPRGFVPVIVYTVAVDVSVGVPVKAPVEILKLNPVGAGGDIAYESEATVLVITKPVIATPTVAVSLIGEIVKSGGNVKARVGVALDGVDQSDVPMPFVALTRKI